MRSGYLPLLLSVGLFLITACVETIEQPATRKMSYLEQRDWLTKSATESLSTGITRVDVENYLGFRMNISLPEVKDISRYDIDETVYVYIVNLKAGGWYVFSGDYSCSPVLCLSDEGYFSVNTPLSRQDELWFQCVRDYTIQCRNSSSKEVLDNRSVWSHSKKNALMKEVLSRNEEPDTMDVTIEVYQDTLANDDYDWLGCPIWHEYAPFNNAVPLANTSGTRCPAGCAVIAIAELLYYTHCVFGYPNDIYESASCNSLYSQQPYVFTFSSPSVTSWNYMVPNWNYISDSDPYTAALCALISKRSQTVYGIDSSGAYGETSPNNIASTLDSFMLDGASMQPLDSTSIMNEIQNDRPVLCSGETPQPFGNTFVGHSYLIEGYYWQYVVETEIIMDPSGSIISEETYTIVNDLQWRINTGNPGRRTYANGVYYPHNKYMYIGWD